MSANAIKKSANDRYAAAGHTSEATSYQADLRVTQLQFRVTPEVGMNDRVQACEASQKQSQSHSIYPADIVPAVLLHTFRQAEFCLNGCPAIFFNLSPQLNIRLRASLCPIEKGRD